MKKKFLYFYPFLFGVYPVFFLYSRNISEYPEQFLFLPLVFSFAFTALVFYLIKLLIKQIDIASIITSIIVLISLSFGTIVGFFPKKGITLGSVIVDREILSFAISILIIGLVCYISLRYRKYLAVACKLLALISVFLVTFSLFEIGMFELKTGRLWSSKNQEIRVSTKKELNKNSQNMPDIYYLIFDRYAGSRSLSEEYKFDNSVFFNLLKDKGFYLAEESTANYPKTFLSLGSSLNMEYLDYLTEKTKGGKNSDQSIVTPLIRYNKALKFLQEKGYSYVHVGPNWNPTSTSDRADFIFEMKKKTYPFADEFTTGFLNTTIFSPILTEIFKDPLDVSIDPYNNEHRRWITEEFKYLENVPKIPGPKFVFAHVLIPHDPFVFDKDCNPISEAIVDANDHVANYMNQLQCANKKVTELVENILKNSKNPPVIIIQSDEGPFPMKSPVSKEEAWINADDAALSEKFPNLNAYYFPNASTSALYPSITPVNSFRVLFNTYFNTDYPLLPDKNYIFQDNQNFYKFTDVTERIN